MKPNQKNTNFGLSTNQILTLVIVIEAFVILIIWLFGDFTFNINPRSHKIGESLGAFGDFFNGVLAPFISLLAAFLVYWAFKEQRKANQILENQILDEKNRQDDANRLQQKQIDLLSSQIQAEQDKHELAEFKYFLEGMEQTINEIYSELNLKDLTHRAIMGYEIPDSNINDMTFIIPKFKELEAQFIELFIYVEDFVRKFSDIDITHSLLQEFELRIQKINTILNYYFHFIERPLIICKDSLTDSSGWRIMIQDEITEIYTILEECTSNRKFIQDIIERLRFNLTR